MARLRIETAPEITIYDEAFLVKAGSGASAPLVEFKNSGGTVVGSVSTAGVFTIDNIVVNNPGTASTDVATRGYVDSYASGINWHQVVNYTTTAALDACTYANGTAGVGATLTGNANGRLVVDGINQTTGQSVLVKNQVDAKQNGIYTITDQGSVSTVFVLTRRSDFNNIIVGQVKAGEAAFTLSGNINNNQAFVLISIGTGTAEAIILGTDNLDFTQFGTANIIAGAGLLLTTNTIDIGTVSSSRIVVNANDIDLATVSQSNTSGSATTTFVSNYTVDSYGRISGKETSVVSFAGYATLASPTFTGTVTVPDASFANAKLANMTTKTYKGRTAGTTGAPEDVAVATLKTDLGLVKGDVGLGNVDNTSDAGKPVSTAGQTALNLKANLASPTFTGTVGIPASTILSLPVIDNIKLGYSTTVTAAGTTTLTVASNEQNFFTGITTQTVVLPVASTMTVGMRYFIRNNSTGVITVQSSGLNTILAMPADTRAIFTCILDSGTGIASWSASYVGFSAITGTGAAVLAVSPVITTPTGIVKGDVGLGNVDNISDVNKPVSTAQQTALNLKANLASPTFTGVPAAPTAAAGTNTTQVATTAFANPQNDQYILAGVIFS